MPQKIIKKYRSFDGDVEKITITKNWIERKILIVEKKMIALKNIHQLIYNATAWPPLTLDLCRKPACKNENLTKTDGNRFYEIQVIKELWMTQETLCRGLYCQKRKEDWKGFLVE